MNSTLHTVATAAAFAIGCVCEIGGVALACFPQLGGNPDPAFVAGSAFLAASGLIQWAPKVGPIDPAAPVATP